MFYVFRCPKCGVFQTSQASKRFICKSCSSSSAKSKVKIYYSCLDASEAIEKVKELKKNHYLEKDKAEGDFFSYRT